jgi:uncharacterized protein
MSTLDTATPATKSSFVQKYPLLTFYVLAFGLTWVFMISDALGSHGILPFRLPIPALILMGYMPTVAALLVTGWTKGRDGIRALLRKLLIVRVGIGWYLFAIFGFAALAALAVTAYNLSGNGPALPLLSKSAPHLVWWQAILAIVPMFIVIGLINGEELAWRGFALPRFQASYNALTSSVIVGILWTLFHLPLFFTATGSSQADMSFVSFLVSTVSLSILYAWMCNNTRGSVFMAYLFHASANTWTTIFSVDHSNHFVDWAVSGLLLLAALIVVVIAGAVNLSRRSPRIQEN